MTSTTVKIMLTACLVFLTQLESSAQTEFVLEPAQSMIMTGKGTGQDATINPYAGQDCYAIVENIGQIAFSVRVQQNGKIIKELPVLKDASIKVKLLKGYELYLDPNPKGTSRARVDYEKMEE